MNKIISWKLELFIVKIHMRYHNKWLVHHGYHFMRHVISYRDLEILLLDMLIEMECSEDGLARTQLATLFFFSLDDDVDLFFSFYGNFVRYTNGRGWTMGK